MESCWMRRFGGVMQVSECPARFWVLYPRIYPLIRHTNHPLKLNCTRFEILEIRLIDLARG